MRQTHMVGATVREAQAVAPDNSFRINPNEPQHAYKVELKDSAFIGPAKVSMDRTIVVEGTLKCGVETRIGCKPTTYRGVAVRISIEDEQVISEIILMHNDPSLNLPVARSHEIDELSVDWQMWARRFNLPLILIEPDGVEQIVSNRVGSLDVSEPSPRRPHAMFAARRPRFLTRRKTGAVDQENKISAREIIART